MQPVSADTAVPQAPRVKREGGSTEAVDAAHGRRKRARADEQGHTVYTDQAETLARKMKRETEEPQRVQSYPYPGGTNGGSTNNSNTDSRNISSGNKNGTTASTTTTTNTMVATNYSIAANTTGTQQAALQPKAEPPVTIRRNTPDNAMFGMELLSTLCAAAAAQEKQDRGLKPAHATPATSGAFSSRAGTSMGTSMAGKPNPPAAPVDSVGISPAILKIQPAACATTEELLDRLHLVAGLQGVKRADMAICKFQCGTLQHVIITHKASKQFPNLVNVTKLFMPGYDVKLSCEIGSVQGLRGCSAGKKRIQREIKRRQQAHVDQAKLLAGLVFKAPSRASMPVSEGEPRNLSGVATLPRGEASLSRSEAPLSSGQGAGNTDTDAASRDSALQAA